jgi:adenosylhomocysteine nucleosidase
MEDVVVFTALGWERRAVMAGLSAPEPAELPGSWRGRLGDGGSCLVVQTGIGPERAHRAAVAAPPARLFLACGCAGALVGWLRAGDLVAADSVVALGEGGRPASHLPAPGGRLAAWAASRGLRVHVGAVASSPVVLATAEAKAAAGADGALVVEMESGAVASVASARGIPFLGLRVVLDLAGQVLALPADVIDQASGELRPARALASLAPPWRWPRAGRLARQSRVAERRLRAFLGVFFAAGGATALATPASVH